jgi:hypothetical protein
LRQIQYSELGHHGLVEIVQLWFGQIFEMNHGVVCELRKESSVESRQFLVLGIGSHLNHDNVLSFGPRAPKRVNRHEYAVQKALIPWIIWVATGYQESVRMKSRLNGEGNGFVGDCDVLFQQAFILGRVDIRSQIPTTKELNRKDDA